jgi:hypothetical protein
MRSTALVVADTLYWCGAVVLVAYLEQVVFRRVCLLNSNRIVGSRAAADNDTFKLIEQFLKNTRFPIAIRNVSNSIDDGAETSLVMWTREKQNNKCVRRTAVHEQIKMRLHRTVGGSTTADVQLFG